MRVNICIRKLTKRQEAYRDHGQVMQFSGASHRITFNTCYRTTKYSWRGIQTVLLAELLPAQAVLWLALILDVS